MTDVMLVQLDEHMANEVASLYAGAFAGPPWGELWKCTNKWQPDANEKEVLCEATYPGENLALGDVYEGMTCYKCRKPLRLGYYWYDGDANTVFENAVHQDGFIGVAARDKEKYLLVAFSWGFAIPDVPSPTVLFDQVKQLLESNQIDPTKTFYAAESGTHPAYQRQGINKRVSYNRLRRASEQGFSGTCFRTINPKLVNQFKSYFGEEQVKPIFNDPDPDKTNRIWYYCAFEHLRNLPHLLEEQ